MTKEKEESHKGKEVNIYSVLPNVGLLFGIELMTAGMFHPTYSIFLHVLDISPHETQTWGSLWAA